MNRFVQMSILTFISFLAPSMAHAQGFASGSNGSFGPINVPPGIITAIDLPPDGIIHATTVTVGLGAVLKFNRNALNTPVFLLATGDIDISGEVNVDGDFGFAGGLGGPGGFNGGAPGLLGSPPGDGQGPGAGRGGNNTTVLGDPNSAGSASYGGLADDPTPLDGQTYGSASLIPIIGGSGGGGYSNGTVGGGGGGAILLASSTRVNISNGMVTAAGGIGALGFAGGSTIAGGHGSGGAIRIVAPVVSGLVDLIVRGGGGRETAGDGRVRIDTIDRSQFKLTIQSSTGAASIGNFMQVFPFAIPRLDIVNVAGQAISEGTPNPVQVLLPSGSPTSQPITIQARDFTGTVPVDVVLTPASGPRQVVQTSINMSTNPAQTTVNVNIPVNVITQINAWTR